MLLLDFSQVVLASIAAADAFKPGGDPLDEAFVRHITLNMIRNNNLKFRTGYGNPVICCDSKNTWRKQTFPYYKARRKKDREENKTIDWTRVFEFIGMIKAEMSVVLPYPVIEVEGAEADDVIGVLARSTDEKVMILSGDHDFVQLQDGGVLTRSRVSQWNPVAKKEVTSEDPEAYLVECVIRGDSGDGVPNVMSADDTFVTGTRQKPITKKRLEEFRATLPHGKGNTEHLRNWARNKQLIDLANTPSEIRGKVPAALSAQTGKGRDKLYGYFMEKRLRNLMGALGDFVFAYIALGSGVLGFICQNAGSFMSGWT